MTCLTDETIASLARGVIPQGQLGQIRAHLPTCPRCREAIARVARVRRDEPPRAVEPGAEPPRARPEPPRLLRWGAVLVASIALGTCLLWAAPQGGVPARVADTLVRAAEGARSAIARVEVRQVWSNLRQRISDGTRDEALAQEPAAASPNVASPTQPALASSHESAAAAARRAEAARLVELSNAIAGAPARQP